MLPVGDQVIKGILLFLYLQEYEVERILNCAAVGTLYCLKWKNFQKPTWQPETDLANCKELLQEFHSVSCHCTCC